MLIVLALAVVLLAAGLRLHRLDAQSLWNDEGNAYVQATRTLPEIADNAARDIHPPGYYSLLAVWRLLTGESEFALRALSAFAGVLTVALTYALGRRLYSPLAGLTAALLVALNTFNIYYSQEARMYALLGLWSVAAMWAFVGFVRSGKREWALAFALFNAAGLYTHYAYPAVMVAQGVLFLLWAGAEISAQYSGNSAQYSVLSAEGSEINSQADQPVAANTENSPLIPHPSSLSLSLSSQPSAPDLSLGTEHRALSTIFSLFPFPFFLTYLLANLLTILLYLPWLPTAWTQITSWPTTGQPIPTSEALTTIVGWFSLGITYQLSESSVAFTFFALFGLLVFPQQDGKRSWWRMLVPVLWVVITLGGFLALGLFREANLKFLIPAQIAYALWIGRGVWILWTLKPRRTAPIFQASPKLATGFGVLALLVALVSGLQPLYSAAPFQRDDYRGIVTTITTNPRDDDAVILNAPGQMEVFRYYYGDGGSVYPLPIGLTVDNDATLAAVREIIASHERIYAVLWGTSERDPQNLVENTLDTEAFEIDNRWFGNVRLVRYVSPQPMRATVESGAIFGENITLASYALSGNGAVYQPDDVLQVQLDWQPDAPVDRRYKIFIQLLSPDGLVVAQRDSEPGGGLLPTDSWKPGETIRDRHALLIPDDLPPAHYRLIIGFYNPDAPQERLPVGDGDYLLLSEITVENMGE